ncbi:VTT domain-containing protein [Halovivax limisalsi]|uniref:VTT domain-containing protein n=1 Tax=Halovivax limisalsi TaxID=1453760 RepID=UPI001FFD71C2|nr:VTT domain-containing protein [Halovivax limisalsi]
MTGRIPSRVHLGAAVAMLAIGAGLLVSPGATKPVIVAIADDPRRFGLAVAACYLLRPLLAWPTTPLAALVGYGFGVTAGIPIAMVGVVGTVVPTFVFARWIAAGTTADAADGRWFASLADRAGTVVDRYYATAGPTRGVVGSRLAPIPSDVATVAAAVHGVSLPRFLAGTALGELPWTIAAVSVGASAASMTSTDPSTLGPFALALGLAGGLVLLSRPLYRYLSIETGRSSTEG